MIMADTDVLIDFLAGRDPAAGRIALELRSGGLGISAISRFELLVGARSPRQQRAVGDLLAALRCLPLDEDAADRSAALRRELEDRGMGIGMAESLIAGTALAHQAILLTRNRKHFERVEGLTLGRVT